MTIIDADGNPVVQYTYDAWGKILSISGPMADTLGANGNSLSSTRINYGYQLIDKDCNVLKHGESKNPLTRYSPKWLNEKGYTV